MDMLLCSVLGRMHSPKHAYAGTNPDMGGATFGHTARSTAIRLSADPYGSTGCHGAGPCPDRQTPGTRVALPARFGRRAIHRRNRSNSHCADHPEDV